MKTKGSVPPQRILYTLELHAESQGEKELLKRIEAILERRGIAWLAHVVAEAAKEAE